MQYIPPSYQTKRFNCPFCKAFADQSWFSLFYTSGSNHRELNECYISICISCGKISIWFNRKLVFPQIITAPIPNLDMPDHIKEDFEEARQISTNSPRSACALLRLCVEKICVELGEKEGNLNTKIGNLVKKGLRPKIQQSLDSVRVIGNESVHPGQLDIRDDPETVIKLFELVNYIIQVMITDEKDAETIFGKISQDKKNAIKERDN